MEKKGKKVFVGLSGGVDSSVSAYMLKKEGYDVTGVFIKVWQPDFVDCTWREDRLDAMRVAALLDIPFVTLDLEEEYKREIIDSMIREYKKGRTPNPDVLCNREVKFGAFFLWAKKEGADCIATGHYAQNFFNRETGEYELHRGIDSSKDQSYFLWTLGQEELSHTLFPVGGLTKDKVRALARDIGLPTAQKKDSQGLCFISNVDMKTFLKRFIPASRGEVLDESGNAIGEHDGAVFFTLGERHGFSIRTKSAADAPYFVVKKDVEKNTITVSHTYTPLSPETIHLEDEHFVSDRILEEGSYECETRYHGERNPVEVLCKETLEIRPKAPLQATSGQSLVLYRGSRCFGGGIIV